jgi:hypothetical protein
VVSDLFQDQKVVDGEPIPVCAPTFCMEAHFQQRTIPSRDPYRPWTLHVYVRPDDCTRRPVTRQTTDPSGRIVTSTEYRDVIGIRYDLKGSNGFVRFTSTFPFADSGRMGSSTSSFHLPKAPASISHLLQPQAARSQRSHRLGRQVRMVKWSERRGLPGES